MQTTLPWGPSSDFLHCWNYACVVCFNLISEKRDLKLFIPTTSPTDVYPCLLNSKMYKFGCTNDRNTSLTTLVRTQYIMLPWDVLQTQDKCIREHQQQIEVSSDRLQTSLNKHLMNWRASPMAQQAKNLPVTQKTRETWVHSLGQEEPLEEEMATHFYTLAWKIPWTERSLVGYSPWGRKELDTTERLSRHTWSN